MPLRPAVRARAAQPIDVEHYDLAIKIEPGAQRIEGSNTISCRALAAADSVRVNLSPALKSTRVTVNEQETRARHENDELIIALPTQLSAGERFTVTIVYQGYPQLEPPFGTGLIFQHHNGTPVVASVSEPYSAPAWWPCVDNSTDKATLSLAVTVPKELTAIANGRFVELTENSDGTRTFRWREDYQIATYLVAVAVSNYHHFSEVVTTAQGQRLPLNYYVYPEDRQIAEQHFAHTRRAVEVLTEIFGDYPFVNEQYGMIEIPWRGAIEHQTLSGIGAQLVRSAFGQEQLIAHELAHQWWGDSVSLRDWSDIWLNEGFATYAETLFLERRDSVPAGKLMSMLDDGRTDGRLAGTVIAEDRENPFDDIEAIYDKGAWVLHMLRGVLGDELFFTALRQYGARYAYGNATTADFQAVCEEVYGGSLEWFFHQWIYLPGRPLYRFSWQAEPAAGQWHLDLQVLQRQPQPVPVKRPVKRKETGAYAMPIPVTIDYGDGTREQRVIFNYYREQRFRLAVARQPVDVRLDSDNWLLKEIDNHAEPNSNDYPRVDIVESVRTNLAAPAHVDLSARAQDDDGIKRLEWRWQKGLLGKGARLRTTFTAPGIYEITLTAVDRRGTATTSAPLRITVR